jgi:hypothetical protein
VFYVVSGEVAPMAWGLPFCFGLAHFFNGVFLAGRRAAQRR